MSSLLLQLDTARPLPPAPDLTLWDHLDASIAQRLLLHWTPPPALPPEEWLRRHLRITGNQSAGDAGQPLDLRRNPQARIVLDFLADPHARELNIEKSSAGGISTTIIAACVHALATNPCNILYLIGNAAEARKMSDVYWRPFLRQAFGAAIADAKNQATLHFKIAGVEVMLGSPTEDTLRGKQFGILVEDESDTMEDQLRGGAQNLDIAERERVKNYRGSKIIRLCCPLYAYDPKASPDQLQPLTRIDRHYQRGDQREYRLPCPSCALEHPIDRAHFHYESARDLTGQYDLDLVRDHLTWRCPACAHEIPDTLSAKSAWYQLGRYVPTVRAASASIWSAKVTDLCSLIGKASSWGYVESEILEAQTQGPSALAGILRSHLAQPLQRQAENITRTSAALLRHCGHHPRGTCPIIPTLVGLAADVQKDASYFPWMLAAYNKRGDIFVLDWGEAQDPTELELIRQRPIPSHLPESLAAERFPDRPVPPVYVSHAVIDSGHRARGDEVDPTVTTVYGFAYKAGMVRVQDSTGTAYRHRWVLLKGRGERQIDMLTKHSQAILSDTIRLPLVLFNDPAFKSELYHLQLAYDPTPGAPDSDIQRQARLLPRILFPRYQPDAVLEDGQTGYTQLLLELAAERYGTIMHKPRYGGPPVEIRKWYVPAGLANNFGDCLKMLKVLQATLQK